MSARSPQRISSAKPRRFERRSGGKHAFRARFQRALSICVKKHFSVAECFGLVWEETLETCALSDPEQLEMYHELLEWAKGLPEIELFVRYSHPIFAGSPADHTSLTATAAGADHPQPSMSN